MHPGFASKACAHNQYSSQSHPRREWLRKQSLSRDPRRTMTHPSLLRVSSLLSLYQRTLESQCPELEGCKANPLHSDTTQVADPKTFVTERSLTIRTCSLLSNTASVVLLPPGLAAFQNCFWAE